MTKEQREKIEKFINQETNIMKIDQGKAIAQAILECHDMLEELTNPSKLLKAPAPPRLHAPIGMKSPEEIMKQIKKSMWMMKRKS